MDAEPSASDKSCNVSIPNVILALTMLLGERCPAMRMTASDKPIIANVLAKLSMAAEPTSKALGSHQAGKLGHSEFLG